ncbi:MAG TPA: ABC transporter permease [Actinomycetota bacterium]|nr:ABC transporter permease [Actinomycetota bacterium]
MGKLLGASIRMLYRDRQALFWALAFPVIFAVIFGLFDFNQAPEVGIAVVADRPSQVSRALVTGLREVESFEVEGRSSLASARTALEDGDVDVALEVPAIPAVPETSTFAVRVLYNRSNFNVNQFALSAIERIVGGLNLRLAGVSSPPIAVRAEAVDAKSVDYYDFLLPGLVAMGVMNFSIIGIAVGITRFREQRILKRMLATPLRPAKFLAAQVLARLVLALAQAAVILAVGVFVFGGRVYGNVLWIFVLATVANLIFLNIGFTVAGRTGNVDAAQGLANFIALPMMFLSGVFFPTDTLPQAVQAVVKYLPLTPLIEALRKVSVDGLSIVDTGPQLVKLGAWVVASFALAAASFRFGREAG